MPEQEWKFGDIDGAVRALQAEHDKLHSLLEVKRARIQLVSSDVWDGTGREAWQNAENAWSDKADTAVEALKALISSVQSAHDTMQSAENKLKDKFA